MRNTLVPQTGHSPCVAGLPFFKVMDFGFLISLFARHFMQYACILTSSLFWRLQLDSVANYQRNAYL
jgi:hypothetical protein